MHAQFLTISAMLGMHIVAHWKKKIMQAYDYYISHMESINCSLKIY